MASVFYELSEILIARSRLGSGGSKLEAGGWKAWAGEDAPFEAQGKQSVWNRRNSRFGNLVMLRGCGLVNWDEKSPNICD